MGRTPAPLNDSFEEKFKSSSGLDRALKQQAKARRQEANARTTASSYGASHGSAASTGASRWVGYKDKLAEVKAREAARSAAAPAELPPPPQRQREKKKSKQRGNSKVFLQLVKVFNFFI